MTPRWRGFARCSLIVVLAGGCFMSLQELRTQAPSRTAVVAGQNHATLARCVGDTLVAKGELTYQILDRPDLTRTSVVAIGDPQHPFPVIELAFQQQDADVLIESRWGNMRAARGLDEEAWPVISRCAGSIVRASPAPE